MSLLHLSKLSDLSEMVHELVVALTWFICLVTFILAIVASCKGKDMFDL